MRAVRIPVIFGVINMSGWWVEPAGDNLCVSARDEYGATVGRYNPRQYGVISYDQWLTAVDRLHGKRKRVGRSAR